MPEELNIDFGADMEATLSAMESGGNAGDADRQSPPADATPASAPGAPAASAPVVTPSTDPKTAPQPTAEEWRSMPKSWKKDYEKHWGKFDPEVQQYVHQREKESLDGIMKYKPVADKWTETVKPYEQIFSHFGQDPAEIFQRLTNTHLAIVFGSPEEQRIAADRLIKDYNLQQFINKDGVVAPPDEAIQQIRTLSSRLQALEGGIQRQAQQTTMADIQAFFAKPENEFANEVSQDMVELIRSGLASDLPSAYEKAIYLNPSVRSKIFEREAAKIAKPTRQAPTNVQSDGPPAAPTGASNETIDETMQETYRKIMGAHS